MRKQRRKEKLKNRIQIKMARTEVEPEELGEFLETLSLERLESLYESSQRAVEEELEEEKLRRWLGKASQAKVS